MAQTVSRFKGRVESHEAVVKEEGTNVSAEELEIAIDRAIGSVAYAITYVNGFRDDDAMTREMVLDNVFTYVEIALRKSSNENVRHWLELARIELLRAKAVLAQTKCSDYEHFLRKAREFLEYAAAGRMIVVDFIATPSGSVQKATDAHDRKE